MFNRNFILLKVFYCGCKAHIPAFKRYIPSVAASTLKVSQFTYIRVDERPALYFWKKKSHFVSTDKQ